jgi:F0F1-type ATP synthase assembly protein I
VGEVVSVRVVAYFITAFVVGALLGAVARAGHLGVWVVIVVGMAWFGLCLGVRSRSAVPEEPVSDEQDRDGV